MQNPGREDQETASIAGVAARRRLRYAAPVQTVLRRPNPHRLASPDRIGMLAQFLKFAVVGGLGFLVDTAVVYALRYPLGLYGAGLVGFLVAATANWLMNRLWTFRDRSSSQGSLAMLREWARYLMANTGGFVLNRGTYAILVTFVAVCAEQPVLAIAAGSIAGMGVNFVLSRTLVFR